MPTDLTGTPTSLGIGTYNVDADAPSGLGFNEAMAQIDALIAARVSKPAAVVTGDVPVWSGTGWVRPTGTPDATKFLRGDGSWAAIATAGTIIAVGTRASNTSTSGTTFAAGADVLAAALSFTADGVSSYLVDISSADFRNTTAAINDSELRLNLDGADAGIMGSVFLSGASNESPLMARTLIVTPSAAVHTVNVRLVTPGGGSAVIDGGAGGAGVARATVVTITKAT